MVQFKGLRTRSAKGRTGPTTGTTTQLRSQAVREFNLSSTFLFCSGRTDWMKATHMERATCFPQSPSSNANLFPKHFYRHTQEYHSAS